MHLAGSALSCTAGQLGHHGFPPSREVLAPWLNGQVAKQDPKQCDSQVAAPAKDESFGTTVLTVASGNLFCTLRYRIHGGCPWDHPQIPVRKSQ